MGLKSEKRSQKRVDAVSAVQRGESPKVVARVMNIPLNTLYDWLSRYRSNGWDGLRDAKKTGRPSVVRHTDCNLFNFSRPRLTFSRMSDALAVQINGFGFSLWLFKYCSIASTSSSTDLKTPRRSWFSVMSRKKRSTIFSHEALVGVKL